MSKQKNEQNNLPKLLAQNNLELAKEYLGIARFNEKYKKSYRGVIDTAYNAAELFAKGCLALKLDKLPNTHKGVIQKFSEFYVKTNFIDREVGKKLVRGLRYRNLSRYEKETQISSHQANEVLELALILQKFLQDQLNASKSNTCKSQ